VVPATMLELQDFVLGSCYWACTQSSIWLNDMLMNINTRWAYTVFPMTLLILTMTSNRDKLTANRTSVSQLRISCLLPDGAITVDTAAAGGYAAKTSAPLADLTLHDQMHTTQPLMSPSFTLHIIDINIFSCHHNLTISHQSAILSAIGS